ncbi:MAG: rod shape-determining protein [Deltaproteobacteria bacterium]|nr:rod shape-determining protein [Deltaproteobacteria bacterium]
MSWFPSLLSNDIAIDLGTATTLIAIKGRGIVSREPSVVAVQQDPQGQRRVLAVGKDAKEMIGRTPSGIEAIRPMRDGKIADFEITEAMLRYFVQRAHSTRSLMRPRVIVCVPCRITDVDKKAVRDSAESTGAREVYLIEEPMAAAIGAHLPITEPAGNMIVVIGGGTTEIAVISLAGIVHKESLAVGGDKMDQAIVDHVRRKHNLVIGDRTAEQVKIKIGTCLKSPPPMHMEVKGRDAAAGVPRTVTVGAHEIREALSEPLQQIVRAVRGLLERTPPELSADIVDKGVVLAGGGALLTGIDQMLRDETNLPVLIAEDPVGAVVTGAAMALDDPNLLRHVAVR